MSRMTARPRKGTAAAERRKRRAAIERAELKAKDAAKKRDAWCCRRCDAMLRCPHRAMGDVPAWLEMGTGPAEAAHLVDAGMGGRASVSSKASDYVTLCHECHQGPRSVHSGHVRMEFGPEGGDGVVRFIDQVPGARHGRCAFYGGVHPEGRFCKGFRPQ